MTVLGMGTSQCLMLWFNIGGKEAFCHCSLSRVLILTSDTLTPQILSQFTQLEANNGILGLRKMEVKLIQ